MRVRRAVWRVAGPAAGRLAPGPFRAYYDAIVGSLARSLLRTPGVVAVYSHGSYGTGTVRPGLSDVDLVAVIEDLDPDREVALLLAVGRRYRPRQAVLPLDLSVLTRSEFPRDAGWIAQRRRLIGPDRPIAPVAEWLHLGGEEMRESPAWEPDPRLAYVTEHYVSDPLAEWARSPKAFARKLRRLATAVERESLEWPSARRLLAAAPGMDRLEGGRDGLVAALALIEEDRSRHAIPLTREAETDGWRLTQPPSEAVATARSLLPPVELHSATLYVDPVRIRPTLLLEATTPDRAEPLITWVLEAGARAAGGAGITLEVTTSLLAEDSWRAGLRWVGVVGASSHIEGTPLAPRLRLPEQKLVTDVLDLRAFTAAEIARSSLIGLRTMRREPWALNQLALVRDLLAGEPPIAPAREASSEGLDDREWTRRAVSLRRECAALIP